ncbi:MAG: hypothetical protein ACOZJX_13295 [Pseudomonadota bacterium]
MTTQTALAFDDLPLPPALRAAGRTAPARAALVTGASAHPQDPDETPDPAWLLGWDYAHHGQVPPAEQMLPGHPLRQGWEAGRAAFGSRTLKATRQVQQWLHLRLQAWHNGHAFEEVQVTPNFLGQIDRARCPITREALSLAVGQAPRTDTDTTVTRLNERAGYAAGNLATLSRRAAQAKAGQRWSDARLQSVLTQARQGAEQPVPESASGLSAVEWARLAVLMSFATPLPHEVAATLPLLVLPPNRLRLVNPIQGLQALITQQLMQHGFAVRIAQLTSLLPGLELRRDFHLFFHTLLPRAWQGGRPASDEEMRDRLEDAWQNADVLRRWQRFASQLSAEQADQLLRRLVAKGLAGTARRTAWHPPARATEGWALDQAGASRG